MVLVNAQSSQNVPGRKTDVPESQWWMKLHTYGLLGDSFRRPPAIEKVGTRWRLRDRPTQEASRSIQHRQKALTQRNVPLANVLSDISGVSGPAILAAILAGERDIGRWADLRDPGVPASREEVARSLEGNGREDVLFELPQAVDSYHFAQRQRRECEEQLQRYLASLPTRTIERPAPPVTPLPEPLRRPNLSGKKPAMHPLWICRANSNASQEWI